jgi:hypothetical protein
VNAVLTGNSKVYVLGSFDTIGDLPNSNVAEVSEATIVGVPEPPAGLPGSLNLSNQPNPFHSRSLIRFSLPRATDVTLSVYDVSGRGGATGGPRLPGAGPQEIRLTVAGCGAGSSCTG